MSRQLTVIRQVLAKDIRLLWPLVLLFIGLQVAHVWLPDESVQLLQFVGTSLVVVVGLIAVTSIQMDGPANPRLDWFARPIGGAPLLCAKLLFLFGALFVPSVLAQLALLASRGVSLSNALSIIMPGELILTAIVMLVVAIAAMTRSLIAAGAVALAIALAAVPSTQILLAVRPEIGATLGEGSPNPGFVMCVAAIVGSLLSLWLQYVPRLPRYAALAFAVMLVVLASMPLSFALLAPPS